MLDLQAKELRDVMDQLYTTNQFESVDVFCTSMGAYASVKILVDMESDGLINKVIFFDPADYYLSSRFSTLEGEDTWSGYMDYDPKEEVVSDRLKDYVGIATIHVIHLTLRNHGPNGYVEKDYRDRGKDEPSAYPRLNTKMVKKFYDNVPSRNQGEYVEMGDVPHGFMRDGNIQRNNVKVAEMIEMLLC